MRFCRACGLLPSTLVNLTQKRHVTSPFPMRPGYGLGSMVPPGLIDGMKKEASIRSKIIVFEQLMNDLESTERQLLLEKNQLVNTQSSNQTLNVNKKALESGILKLSKKRDDLMNKKIGAYIELVDYQNELFSSTKKEEKAGSNELDHDNNLRFSTFASNIESPIDWSQSIIKCLPRANESISITSQFFDVNKSSQDGTSHAENVAGGVSETVKSFWGPSETSKVASSVHNSVTNTMSKHNVESTLILTAMATHKWVKQLIPCIVDTDILIKAWNYYHHNNKFNQITIATLPQAIEKATKNTRDVLSMISEEYLGSSLVGMVHFIKQESTKTSQSSQSVSANAMASFKESCLFASITGNTEISTQAARKAMNSLSSSGIDVVFNIVVLGYMPTIVSRQVNDAIKEFANFSPDKLSVDNDNTLFKSTMAASNNISENLSNNQESGKMQSDSGAMIKATIEGLHDAYSNNYQVLDYNTFMNAFDDYVKNAPKNEMAGIPVGMNIKQWNELDILLLYQKKLENEMNNNNTTETNNNNNNNNNNNEAQNESENKTGGESGESGENEGGDEASEQQTEGDEGNEANEGNQGNEAY